MWQSSVTLMRATEGPEQLGEPQRIGRTNSSVTPSPKQRIGIHKEKSVHSVHLSLSSLILHDTGNDKGEFFLFSVQYFGQLFQKDALAPQRNSKVQVLCCNYFSFRDVPFCRPTRKSFLSLCTPLESLMQPAQRALHEDDEEIDTQMDTDTFPGLLFHAKWVLPPT